MKLKKSPKAKKQLAESAAQIVFSYEPWGWEHISDFMACFEPGEAHFDGDQLYDACALVKERMDWGDSYSTAVDNVTAQL